MSSGKQRLTLSHPLETFLIACICFFSVTVYLFCFLVVHVMFIIQGKKEESNTCVPCEAGTHQPNEGQTICPACPTGQFTNQTGQESCKKCPDVRHNNIYFII